MAPPQSTVNSGAWYRHSPQAKQYSKVRPVFIYEQRHEEVQCARMEVYIHALTLALKPRVVSSAPQRGPRASIDSAEARKMSVPAGNRVLIPIGVVTTVTELPQSVKE